MGKIDITRVEEGWHRSPSRPRLPEPILAHRPELSSHTGVAAVARQVISSPSRNYRELFELVPEGYLVTDTGTVIRHANQAALALFRCTLDGLDNRSLTGFLSGNEAERLKVDLLRLGVGERLVDWEGQFLTCDGERFAAGVTVAALRDPDDKPVALCWLLRDITAKKRAEAAAERDREKRHLAALERQQRQFADTKAKLEKLALLDGLTGLKNHRAFQERLEMEFQRALRYGTPLSLILLDVDHFKKYNDSYGHVVGDEVLKSVAALLQQNCRISDFVARYGGEEFAVILPHTDIEQTASAGEQMREAVAAAAWSSGAVTVSLGATALTPDMRERKDLIRRADEALYISKRGGRNRLTCL